MSKEELLFCPLGGSGEIGANMNLYAYGKENDHKWIIIDMGVSFADDSIPGVDLIMPDPGFIIDKKDDLLGIVLTSKSSFLSIIKPGSGIIKSTPGIESSAKETPISTIIHL